MNGPERRGARSDVPFTLVLLRHGQSTWNLENRFTGWIDVDLTDEGRAQARRGGADLRAAGILPDIVHTSLQVRAIYTAELALRECGRSWIPVRRSWRLNERHYGALQGKNKAETAKEFGAEQVKVWRRAYDVPPEPLDPNDVLSGIDERYADVPPELLPRAECLKDVLERMLPWWEDEIVPDLRTGKTVLVAAHGNSLRALVKHLDGMTPEAVIELNLPTGEPLVYELDDELRPPAAVGPGGVRGRYLDPGRAVAAADAVARQAG
jgi:2,3-bisphosphoglycerate-dependent phosphoglycerate mutase